MKKQLIPILGLGLALVLGGCDNGNNNNGNDGVRTPDLVENNSTNVKSNRDDVTDPRLKFDVTPLLAHEASIVKNFPKSSNELAFDLYKKFADTEANPVFSPLSISTALAMIYAGALEETETALKKVLHFGDNTPGFHQAIGDFSLLLANKDLSAVGTTFEISNAVWLQKEYPVLEEFKKTLAEAYKSQSILLDFMNDAPRATEIINKTIAAQTHGEIPELLKTPVPADTKLILTNAIYLNAKWDVPFDPFMTREGAFATDANATRPVQYMIQTDEFLYGENDQKQYVLLRYRDQEFATLLVLPKEGSFAAVESSLSHEIFTGMLHNLREAKVNVMFPKFVQRTLPDVKKALVDLGMGIAFGDHANFKGINNDVNEKGLTIHDIVHEAVVKIYEEGTTAAAATAVIAVPDSASPAPNEPEEIINFHAERPFLFFIIHQPSETILFMGKITEPESQSN